MAYTRGDPYIWSDGERLHLWSDTGNDGWSEMEAYSENSSASGVAIQESKADEFAVMRFAEIVQSGELASVVARTLSLWGGNSGSNALGEIANELVEKLQK